MPYQQRRIPIGQYRERIDLFRRSTSDDGMGGQASGLTAVAQSVPAQVWALDERTKEALAAQSITARHGYHVAIRYREGVTPKLIAIVRDSTMEVHTVTDDEGRRRRLILQVAEVQ